MSNDKLDLKEISQTMMQLFVQDVLSKNNISNENKRKLSDEQKEQLKKVVADLQAQVDEFVKGAKAKEETEKVEEAPKNMTLRERLRNRKNDN